MHDPTKIKIIQLSILMMIIDKDIDDLEVQEICNIIIEDLSIEIPDDELHKLIRDVSSDLYERDVNFMVNKLSFGIDMQAEKEMTLNCLKKVMDADGIVHDSEKDLITKLKNKWNS